MPITSTPMHYRTMAGTPAHLAPEVIRVIEDRYGAYNIRYDAYNIHPDAYNIHPNAYNIHPNAYNIHPDAYNIHPDACNIHPNALPHHGRHPGPLGAGGDQGHRGQVLARARYPP
eukprot:1183480-Prorocentrum_minimum.AAC.2